MSLENIYKILSIKVNLSLAFYAETNRQSEITNQEIERHICTFVNYWYDNWLSKLAIAEFIANNNKSTFIKLSLFFVTKSLYPFISFDLVELFNTSTCGQILR